MEARVLRPGLGATLHGRLRGSGRTLPGLGGQRSPTLFHGDFLHESWGLFTIEDLGVST